MLVDYSDSEAESESGEAGPDEAACRTDADADADINNKKQTQSTRAAPSKRPFLSAGGGTAATAPGPPAPPPPPPPPPPAAFRSLYATSVRAAVSDDPALHGGRARQVGHVPGNWPTHVFLEWTPAPEELRQLDGLVQTCSHHAHASKEPVHSLLRSELDVPRPLHVSLSAPLTLTTERKEAVAAAVEEAVVASSSRAFNVRPTGRLAWVSNADGSRAFLVLKLARPPNDEMNRLLRACNAAVARFGLKTLYSDIDPTARDDAFHISIAWTLGGTSITPRQRHVVGDDYDDDHDDHDTMTTDDCGHDITSVSIPFDTVKLKIGSVVRDIPLPPPLP